MPFPYGINREAQFKPGAEWTGNRNGRPKSVPLEARILKVLEDPDVNGKQAIDAVIRVMLLDALKGDAKARRDLLDRAYGKVPLRIAGADGDDLTVKVVWPDDRVEAEAIEDNGHADG